ncbi:DGQHR domain-containing protein [Paraburkholderia sp. BL27I4N3]|uniref:DGQHR domain-containing protein n=1 Tax=Paraburkholderia sp. BL27I4N3 TaxID=1938805 RepID=UPI000E22CDDF|nr:DGQHR domain-containing protein [Paraburkholderia sp. BL27I4N3]REE17154.1 DGQHR domain-containing protein [Paraburkholderia sp. BL27I4N3]
MATYKYSAIIYRQRDTADQLFCVFPARVGEVQLWATVDRLTPENKAGVQRERKDARVDAIGDFFKADDRNTIPTSIIIAIPRASLDLGGIEEKDISTQPVSVAITIDVPDGQPVPGLIIDGQHRTYGIAKYDSTIPVNVVAIVGAGDDEIAFQFIVINNKVSKVSPDHIKALKLEYSDANLDSRLTRSARMRSSGAPAYLEQIDTQDDSPFKGMLKWPRNEVDAKRSIPLNAFEMALMHIGSKRLDQVGGEEGVSSDFIARFFIEMWKRVKASWPALWDDPASRLLKKVGVVCMSQYLVDTLVSWSLSPYAKIDLTDLNQAGDVVTDILKQQEMAFWTAEWDAASLDTKSGREWVVDSLERIQYNKANNLPWNKNVSLTLGKKDASGE